MLTATKWLPLPGLSKSFSGVIGSAILLTLADICFVLTSSPTLPVLGPDVSPESPVPVSEDGDSLVVGAAALEL